MRVWFGEKILLIVVTCRAEIFKEGSTHLFCLVLQFCEALKQLHVVKVICLKRVNTRKSSLALLVLHCRHD